MRCNTWVAIAPARHDPRRLIRVFSRPVIVAVAALVLLATQAQAQLAPQWSYCTGSAEIDWNTQIRNCTTLIQSGRETQKNRSIAYINRGLAYYTLKDFNRSIADNTEA